MLLFADSEKASERHYRVSHFAGLLVNHQPLDRTDVIALRIVHGRAFYAIALDKRLAGHHAGSMRRDAGSAGGSHLSLLVIEADDPPAEVVRGRVKAWLFRNDLSVTVDLHVLRAMAVRDSDLVLHAAAFTLDFCINGFAANLFLGRRERLLQGRVRVLEVSRLQARKEFSTGSLSVPVTCPELPSILYSV